MQEHARALAERGDATEALRLSVKVVTDQNSIRNARTRANAATQKPCKEAQRLLVKVLTDRKLDKNAASPILRQGV